MLCNTFLKSGYTSYPIIIAGGGITVCVVAAVVFLLLLMLSLLLLLQYLPNKYNDCNDNDHTQQHCYK